MNAGGRRSAAGRGIPVRARAGAFGTHMWSRRWMADLESSADRRDVHLARSEARNRRVLSLEHSASVVRLDVAGSRPLPFTVTFRFSPLDDPDRQALTRALRAQEGGVLAALDGRYDDEAGFLLLPAVHGQTEWECHCPVQPGPCRHVLAAGCVLVEWWDRDPGVLFTLRGLDAATLGVTRGGDDPAAGADVVDDLWGHEPVLPVVPSPAHCGLEDLLDGPVAHRLAAAAATDPLEQMRVIADLEDFYAAFGDHDPHDLG